MPKRGERMPVQQRAKIAEALRARGTADSKRCPRCTEVKPRTAFGVRSNGHTKSWCRPCESARAREYHQAHPEATRARNRRTALKRYFGLTEAEYAMLHEAQGGRCAICRRVTGDINGRRLFVDHCHDTGRIRGLLCAACNSGIGHLGHDPEVMRRAIEYLRRPPIEPPLYAKPAWPNGASSSR